MVPTSNEKMLPTIKNQIGDIRQPLEFLRILINFSHQKSLGVTMRWLRWTAIFLFILFTISTAHSLICVTITQSNDWDGVKMVKGKSYFFTTKIYNNSAGGGYCDPGNYEVKLKLENKSLLFDDIFDGNAAPKTFTLNNNGDMQVLVTLTPKVDFGKYTVLVMAERKGSGGSGTSIISTATAKIKTIVGDESDPDFTEVPFWMIRKDCPGGYVVRQEEECPRLCENNKAADEDGLCPEDKKPISPAQPAEVKGKEPEPLAAPTGFSVFGLSVEMLVALAAVIVAIVALVFSFTYIKTLKKQLREGRL